MRYNSGSVIITDVPFSDWAGLYTPSLLVLPSVSANHMVPYGVISIIPFTLPPAGI